jgi:hypothetical protein
VHVAIDAETRVPARVLMRTSLHPHGVQLPVAEVGVEPYAEDAVAVAPLS